MKRDDNFYIIARAFLFVFLKFFFFFKVTGRENIPKTGGCIIASNHLSYLDPVVLSVASPRILSFMAKDDLFQRWRLFNMLITALNAFPVKRGRGDLKAIRLAIDMLKSGKTLIIFPEGSRSSTGRLKSGESGIGMLSAKADVCVVPALIEGTDQGMPVGTREIFLFKPFQVHFGKPLRYKELNLNPREKGDYQIFADKVIAAVKSIKNKNSL